MAIVITKIYPMLNKPSHKCQRLLTCCQNGEISPNLVALVSSLAPHAHLHRQRIGRKKMLLLLVLFLKCLHSICFDLN